MGQRFRTLVAAGLSAGMPLVVLLGVAVWISAGLLSAQPRPGNAAKAADYSLTISTNQAQVKVGAEMKLKILQKNVAPHPFQVSRVWKSVDKIDTFYKVYVHDEKGNLVQATEYGRKLMAGRKPSSFVGSSFINTLEPGECMTGEITLTELYVPDPGSYTVQLDPRDADPDADQ